MSIMLESKKKLEYKFAKADERTALRNADRKASGDRMDNYLLKKRAETVTAKAKYNAAKALDSKKADEAEFKTYTKAIKKSNDLRNTTSLYNDISSKKGKAYADSVVKSAQNELYNDAMVGSAVIIGAYVMSKVIKHHARYGLKNL